MLALCAAAPLVRSGDVAKQLLDRLSPYLPNAHAHVIAPSSNLRDVNRAPHEILTAQLTSAMLSVGVRFPQQRTRVVATLWGFVDEWSRAAQLPSTYPSGDSSSVHIPADSERPKALTLGVSLVGFVAAAAEHAGFWDPAEQLRLVRAVRSALNEKFLVALETALSVIRHERSIQPGLVEWKRYIKHYAATGRPLGAISLHDAFMNLVVACASLLVAPARSPQTLFERLRAFNDRAEVARCSSRDPLVEGLVHLAVEEMDRLEGDLDYLQRVGSVWQQRLASAVKAKVLTTFLCCSVYDDEIADPETLTAWLDAGLNDPFQISDSPLTSTILDSMLVLATLSNSFASNLSHSLQRAIIQGNFDNRNASLAAGCLAQLLNLQSQDAIITTLYSLGNVLSTHAVAERASPNPPLLNGSAHAQEHGAISGHLSAESASSFATSDMDERYLTYAAVVDAIVAIARHSKDEKITALALSMLVQKIGRTSHAVDAKMITESARLAVYTNATELRSLLKFYVKVCHDAIANEDSPLLLAVRFSSLSIMICAHLAGDDCEASSFQRVRAHSTGL